MKGLAHIGVLKILEDYKVPVDMISGTSMGAVIGALYSAEPNAKKLEKEVMKENLGNFFDYTLSRHGIIKGKKIEEYLDKKLEKISFKDLKIPLFITACDLERDREIIFHKGDVAKAVRASISIPGIFIPVENNHKILVDGGLIDPIPVDVLRKFGADIVIAVNVDYLKENKPVLNEKASRIQADRQMPSIMDISLRSLSIMSAVASRAELLEKKADLVINIKLEGAGLFDYKKAKFYIRAGKTATRSHLKKIQALTEASPLSAFFSELNRNLKVGKIGRNSRKDDDEE